MDAEYENGINVARPKGRSQCGNLLVLLYSVCGNRERKLSLLPVYILHVLY